VVALGHQMSFMFLFTTPSAAPRETPTAVRPQVPFQQPLARAAQATGVSFDYLAKTAERESRFDPTAKAGTSSATGMFQFLDQTWLDVVRTEGARLGLGQEAAAISRQGTRLTVSDPALRQKIMGLREDPTVSSMMAGAFAARNGQQLGQALGRKPSEGELYIAHFMGPSGARDLIKMNADSPRSSAAAAFPDAAGANRSVFFDKSGRARSVGEVYANLTTPFAATAVAGLPAETAATQTAAQQMFRVKEGGKVMHGLFRSAGEPVAMTVAEAWQAVGRSSDPATRVAFYPGQASASSAPVVGMAVPATGGRVLSNPAEQGVAGQTRTRSGGRAAAAPGIQTQPLDLLRFIKVPPRS
jgi:Transglycosylase SLT domain